MLRIVALFYHILNLKSSHQFVSEYYNIVTINHSKIVSSLIIIILSNIYYITIQLQSILPVRSGPKCQCLYVCIYGLFSSLLMLIHSLIQLDFLSLAEQLHTQVYEDDLKMKNISEIKTTSKMKRPRKLR